MFIPNKLCYQKKHDLSALTVSQNHWVSSNKLLNESMLNVLVVYKKVYYRSDYLMVKIKLRFKIVKNKNTQ